MSDFTLPKGTILRHKVGKVKSEEKTYTIERVLGQGGFGITYLATATIAVGNTKHKILFAIKEFFIQKQCYRDEGDMTMRYSPAAKEDVEECLKEFIAEARRLNQICKDTTHVVDVNEVFEANGTAYYVMEYLDGGTLRDVVADMTRKGEALSEKKACDYLLPVAEAVAMTHEKYRLLHCDISPDNIMLRRSDDGTLEPVLIDFGESLHFNSKGSLTTKHDSQGCKDGFTPLEQYGGIKAFDPRIDVYALAATLYYLVAGRIPKSALEITREDVEKGLPENLSDTLRAAILHGMARDKTARTANVRDFIDEIGAEKPRGQLIPDELPIGTVIKDAATAYAYQIATEGNKTPYYIHYKVVRADNTATGDVSGKTKRGTCDLYEFYDSNAHERQADRTVLTHGDASETERKFVEFCGKKTKGAIDDAFTPGDDYGWHTFDANGTHYLVVTHIRKPLPWEIITKAASYALKGILAAAVLAGVIYLGILGWNAASGLFSKKSSEPVVTVKSDTHDTQSAQETQDWSDDDEEAKRLADQAAEEAKEEAKRQVEQILGEETTQDELAKKQAEELAKKQKEEQAKKQQEEQKKKEELAKKQKEEQETNRQCASLYNSAKAALDTRNLKTAWNTINSIQNKSATYYRRSDVQSLRKQIEKTALDVKTVTGKDPRY